MKKIQLILNIVFGAGLIALTILYFVNPANTKTTDTKDMVRNAVSLPSATSVYVIIDSLIYNYDMYFDMQREFERKYKISEAEFNSKTKEVQKEYEDFQYKWDRGLITRSQAAELEQSLKLRQQELYELENNLKMKLAEEEQVMLNKVMNSVMVYLDSQKSTYNYQYVFGTRFGDHILYANDSLNITKSVLKGLNEEYLKKKTNK